MSYALCPMPYALCPMPYALCPMPYALCPMPYAQSYLIFLRKVISTISIQELNRECEAGC